MFVEKSSNLEHLGMENKKPAMNAKQKGIRIKMNNHEVLKMWK